MLLFIMSLFEGNIFLWDDRVMKRSSFLPDDFMFVRSSVCTIIVILLYILKALSAERI